MIRMFIAVMCGPLGVLRPPCSENCGRISLFPHAHPPTPPLCPTRPLLSLVFGDTCFSGHVTHLAAAPCSGARREGGEGEGKRSVEAGRSPSISVRINTPRQEPHSRRQGRTAAKPQFQRLQGRRPAAAAAGGHFQAAREVHCVVAVLAGSLDRYADCKRK